MILASKTLEAIENAVAVDQGAAFRQNLERVIPHIGDAYRGTDAPFRSHLGASLIGRKCPRELWYGFHWSKAPSFPGRVLRLFNRGHLEEARFIALLLTIGVRVWQQDENGNQYRIATCGGHFGGSGDGVACGIPDLAPTQYCLLEFKTSNDKSFKKLVLNGVESEKHEHYVQMNIYMRQMGIPVALYMSVNKNDDAIHAELVYLDTAVADQYLDRAEKIVFATEAPPRIGNSAGWFECRFCDFKGLCHRDEAPAMNCRTCKFSVASQNGLWYCNKLHDQQGGALALTKEMQLQGCSHYSAREDYGSK